MFFFRLGLFLQGVKLAHNIVFQVKNKNPQYLIFNWSANQTLDKLSQPIRMINDFMKTLCESVKQKLINKTESETKKRAEAIGIKEEKIVHWQRFYFLICQHIAHYIDQHVQIETDKNTIPFVLAVFIFHNIVDFKYKVWSSVSFIKEMEKKYRQLKTDEILQVFKPNENITIVPFERQFSCMCNNKSPQLFSQCQKCLKSFHPSCQYQKLVCNKCYLTHYFFPIDWTFYNRFGEKYHTQTYFHGKFKTFNSEQQKKVQLITMEFEISDFADLQNAQEPQLWIKIMNFNDLSHNDQNERWKNMTNRTSEYSMILNSNKFEFYMNFEPLRKKFLYFRNENSLIFKLENRLANEKDNVLMIVCHPDYHQQETYEIGVFRMKKAIEGKYSNMSNPFDISDEKCFRLSTDQCKLLDKHSQNSVQTLLRSPMMSGMSEMVIAKSEKPKMKESESESQNEVKKKPKLELVRSYGCTHKEGFDYYKMKHHYDKVRESCRPVNKKSQKEKSLNQRLADVKRQQRQETEKRVKAHKSKAEEIKKQEKKYGKFLKCPVCWNHMMSLYLLPYELKEGEEMRNIHSGVKRKVGLIKSVKLDNKIFEPRRPIFPIQKKQEEDDESYSAQQQQQYAEPSHQPSSSGFCTIVQSPSDHDNKFNEQRSLSHFMNISSEEYKASKCEPIQDLQEGEMALNSQQERQFHFQKAAEKIFRKKHEVMSEESSYSVEDYKVEMIEVEQSGLEGEKIVEEGGYEAMCQGFQSTGVTYVEEQQKEEKENTQQQQNIQKMNSMIIGILKAKNQIETEPPSKEKTLISLLSEDEESGQIRLYNL